VLFLERKRSCTSETQVDRKVICGRLVRPAFPRRSGCPVSRTPKDSGADTVQPESPATKSPVTNASDRAAIQSPDLLVLDYLIDCMCSQLAVGFLTDTPRFTVLVNEIDPTNPQKPATYQKPSMQNL
jgi:hypothetical protein